MHGNSPEFHLLVNAEVDSMGGVIDGGVGTDSKISPRRAAIDKAQAELRQEYDVREERRRELEFLEKGGNPLDFKLGPATSISVQSTSVADQFVNSEAKDSFAQTASPRGDSVESSGRPGAASTRETNTADNLLLFDGENDIVLGKQTSTHHGRSNVPPSEKVSKLDGCNNVKGPEDSGMLRFVVKNHAYARRNRSKPSRENSRLCSTDLISVGNRNGSSVSHSRHGARDVKGIFCEASMMKDRAVKSNCNAKSTKPNGNVTGKTVVADNQLDKESDARQACGTTSGPARVGDAVSDVRASKKLRGMDHNQFPQEDTKKSTKLAASMMPDSVVEKGVSSALNCMPSAASVSVENVSSASQGNSYSTFNKDGADVPKEGDNNMSTIIRKHGVDPESSCIETGLCVDENRPNDCPLIPKKLSSPGNSDKEMTFVVTSSGLETINSVKEKNDTKAVKEKNDTKAVEVPADKHVDSTAFSLPPNSGSFIKVEAEKNDSILHMKNELKFLNNNERTEHKDHRGSCAEVKSCDLNEELSTKRTDLNPQGRPSNNPSSSNCDPMKVSLSSGCSVEAPELQNCDESKMKLSKKVHEESILEEARSIEAKRKRIAELSVHSYPLLYRRKSHWDFVLEEMAWLANDFMQERLWKITAAAQVSHKAALSAQLRIKKESLCCEQKHVAHTVTKAVMEFWRSAEERHRTNSSSGHEKSKLNLAGSEMVDEKKAMECKSGDTDTEISCNMEKHEMVNSHSRAIQEYAVRFLKYSISLGCPIQPRTPKTPERLSDTGIVEMFSEDRFSEEALFYTVPPGAMEEYRKSVENDCSKYEKIDSSVHGEEVETSIYGAVEEFGARENVYEEDEAGTYCLPVGYEGIKASKFVQKRKKALQKSYARSLDVGDGLSYGQFNDNKKGANHSLFLGKRPNNINVGSIPIKRVRTASRRLTCAGAAGSVQVPGKTDASSGDTCSYQDDQSTIHGGSHNRKTMEAESTGEYGKQLPFDYTEVSMKPKKRKKPKNMVHKHSTENGAYVVGKGPAYEQRWQLDSMVQNEQRDYSKKRSESHAFESNGNSGVFGQHVAKRPKILKQSQDTSESNTPMTGSVPSPVASQMSNMSSPNKFMKMIAGRERGRKNKALKVPAGQSGSGSPWSLFEDQALVVLVHDMGPNWELVSDAISSTLQFKCIFRNPKECKERHKVLMDRNAGDGADSAEDSGSSQPYPSTLPGIPKGSARQLFQRLQGPMEEDTLKSHFEKIILIGHKQHSRRSQSDNQALKQITPVHNSHAVALSQVSPNNLNGILLTPLDLCDTSTSSSDVTLGPQGSHTSGLAVSNQGPTQPVHPTAGANPMLQGSAPMVLDNSLPSPSSTLNTSSRDGQRYGVPRSPSLPNNENQKMQQYTQMFPGKNSQHGNVSAPGSLPTDRGVRMLPGGNGMGVMSGLNRGMPMPRPGYQGIGSPTMLNMVSSGSILSTSGGGIPNTANMPNGVVSGQGGSMMRPREGLHIMRVPEEQRQMTMQELQMHVTQGNSQPSFNVLGTGYSNQSVSAPVQTFPVQHHQQHPMAQQSHVLNNPHHPHLPANSHTPTSQHQAYMVRIAKERQLQQRMMQQHNQQQPHQFASSNATVPHVQPQQHPLSTLPNNSHIQQQASSQPLSTASANTQHPLTSPMNQVSTQSQQKQHHLQQHGLGKTPQTSGANLPNQLLKQRQRQQQQHQHPGRHHPQQRQQSQSHQQAKLTKGMGRGNMMVHQNIPIDTSHVNGNSGALGHNVPEKSEQAMLAMQGQGLYPGPGSNSIQQGKSLVPQQINQGPVQQNLFSRSSPPSSKQLLQVPSHADNSNKGQQAPSVSVGHAPVASQQPVIPLPMPQQQQPPHRGPSQSQPTVHRMLQQNCPLSPDPSLQSPIDQNQVDQEPLTSTFHMATVPSIPAPSASAPSQWKAQEPLSGLSAPNTTSHLAGSSSLPSSLGSESVTVPNQGPIQRQSSGGMPIHTYGVQPQWQPHMQQQKQLVPPLQQPSPPQQHQLPPSQQPQMQLQSQQNLQSVQGCLYTAPSNSGPA